MSRAARVVFVGLDGADAERMEVWMREGRLPHLAALRSRGAYARLRSTADCFPASVWPCFLHGVNPGKSSVYASFPLVPGSLDVRPMQAADNPYRPFSCYGEARNLRVALLDVPKSVPAPGARGIQLVAWGAHAPNCGPASVPPALYDEIVREFGRYPLPFGAEDAVDQSHAYYRGLREKLLAGVRAKARLTRQLLARDSWDLLVSVWGEIHSGGHRFLHFAEGDSPDAPEALRTALRDLYTETDRCLGELLEALPHGTAVVVASVHGMMRNHNAQELLPRLLERWAGIEDGTASRDVAARLAPSWLASEGMRLLRGAVPGPARDELKRFLPRRLRDALRTQVVKSVFGWRHWPRMRAFCMPTDDCGYVRVNLRGREPDGLVAPGAEYERVLDELAEELLALREIDSGGPIVAKVTRPRDVFHGPAVDRMPDLVATWHTGNPVRGLRSPRFGDVVAPSRLQHRSGLHRSEGFALAAGPGIAAGGTARDGHILDLAPTVLALLGKPPPEHLDGRPLLGLLDGTGSPSPER